MLKTLPKSPFAQALSYAIKQEIEVMRIMESGVYELDNNSIERQMKYIAIGRKNCVRPLADRFLFPIHGQEAYCGII